MMSAMLALCLAPLLLTGIGVGHQEAGGVTLTSMRPVGWISVDPADAAARSPILELIVARVHNPGKIPISLAASLERTPRAADDRATGRVGSVTFFPPDQPGRYLLDTAGAFRDLDAARRQPGDQLKLRLEISRVHEGQDWSGIEVEVAPPRWRALSERRTPARK